MQRGSIAAATSVSVLPLSDKPATAAIITIDALYLVSVAVCKTADQLKPCSRLPHIELFHMVCDAQ